MALSDRTIDFPVAGGLNEGADELQSQSPLLADAADCVFLKDGRVQRRAGTLTASASAGAFPNAVFARKGRAFTHAEAGFTSRPTADGSLGKPLNATAPRPCDVTTDPLVRSSADAFDPDVATVGGYLCAVWASLPTNTSIAYSSDSIIYARIVDEATGAVVLDVTLATDATNPRVVQLGTRFLVTLVSAGAMAFYTWDTGTPSDAWSVFTVLHSGAVSGYDLCVAADPVSTTAAFVAIYDTTGVTMKRIDGVTLAIISQGPNALTDVKAIGVCHVPGTTRVWTTTFRNVASNQILLAFSNATTLATFTAAGTQDATNYATDIGIGGNIANWRIAVEQKSLDNTFSNDRLIVVWSWAVSRDDTGAASVYAVGGSYRSKCVESCLASQTGYFSSSLATSPGYELVSKPFLLAADNSDGVCPFLVKWSTEGASTIPGVQEWISLQSAGLLVVRDGIGAASRHVPVARLFNDGCASLGYSPYPLELAKNGFKPRRLTSMVRSSVVEDQLLTAAEVYIRAPLLRNSSGLDPVDNGIDVARVGFRSACRPLRWLNAGGGVSAHGGFHAVCDGVRAMENSIHCAPERPRRELGGVDGGWFATPTSTHNIVAGWVFYDADGFEHRSALSPPASTGTNATPTVGLTVHVSPPPLTGAGRLMLRLWATGDIDAGAPADVFYLCFEGDALTLPAPSGAVGWVTVSPNVPDTSNSELPYTTGGVLPSEAPPALRDLAAWQDVLVGIDAADRNLLWYTKPLEPGIAPEWNAALTIRLPSDGGDVVSLNTVDDKLVCLKERAVYYVVGTPRNALGLGTDPTVIRVASDVGCIGRHTTAVVPDGLLFVANGGRGLCLLDRGMSLRRMRQAEDRFATLGAQIHSAIVVPHESCVRWGTISSDDGQNAIVLDYEHGALSRFTSYAGTQHHTVIDGRVWLLGANGAVVREALPGEDALTQAPYWSITTTWIKLGGLNGFQRVRRLVLLATQSEVATSAVGLLARVFYDYDESALVGSASWMPLQWGPGANGKQVMWHLPKQKCTSIRFVISEQEIAQPSQPPGATFYSVLLSQLSLRVGVKNTPTKNLAATSRSPASGGA